MLEFFSRLSRLVNNDKRRIQNTADALAMYFLDAVVIFQTCPNDPVARESRITLDRARAGLIQSLFEWPEVTKYSPEVVFVLALDLIGVPVDRIVPVNLGELHGQPDLLDEELGALALEHEVIWNYAIKRKLYS